MKQKFSLLDVLALAWIIHRMLRKEEPEPPLFRQIPQAPGGHP